MFREYFRGGVNLPQRTKLTEHSPFQNIAVPYLCRFPLSQHTGKPAVPCVAAGETVIEGQVIARADGDSSADIHTSIPGRVKSIDTITTTRNTCEPAITIEACGGFPFFNQDKPLDWHTMDRSDILNSIRRAGIVRLGGSPVPEHLRLPQHGDAPTTTIIINAIESEPYLSTAAALLSQHQDILIEGVRILMKLSSAKQAVFALDAGTDIKTINALRRLIRESGDSGKITIKKIPSIYPYGADAILARIIAHTRITPGEQPKKHGILIETAATVFAIYEAVTANKPLYEKFITVSGRGIRRPGNYKIRLGTPLSHIIEECGGMTSSKTVILSGGPMRGTQIDNTDAPVDKSVSALLFLNRSEISRGKSSPCIRCGKCVDRCPMGLNPRSLAIGTPDQPGMKLCIGCAICSYICPSGIDLSRIIIEQRNKIRRGTT
jgi:electron transport complex protein RnfC